MKHLNIQLIAATGGPAFYRRKVEFSAMLVMNHERSGLQLLDNIPSKNCT